MATITVRLPNDAHKRIKDLASSRNISVNKLYEELSIIALAEYDAKTRFKVRSAAGSRKRGLEIIDQLNSNFSSSTK